MLGFLDTSILVLVLVLVLARRMVDKHFRTWRAASPLGARKGPGTWDLNFSVAVLLFHTRLSRAK